MDVGQSWDLQCIKGLICDPIWEKGDKGEFRKQRSNTFNRLRRKAWKRILYAFKQIFNAFKQPALLHFNFYYGAQACLTPIAGTTEYRYTLL